MKQELFIKEINMLNDMLEKNNKKDKNLISNLIKDIYESLINDLSKDYKKEEINEILNNTFKKEAIALFNNINDYYYISLEKLNKSLRELVEFIVVNPLMNIKSLCTVTKTFKEKVNNIPEYAKKDVIISDLYQMVSYETSIKYKLKYDVEKYSNLNKILNRNKKIFINTIDTFIHNKINNNYENFKVTFANFINEILVTNKEIRTKNSMTIKEYAYSLLNDNSNIIIKKYTKNSDETIESLILTMHEEIKNKLKLKDKKELDIACRTLFEYIIQFNNTLYAKALNTIDIMNKIVFSNKDTSTKEIKKYSEEINKLSYLEYNFDKQFEMYKKVLLKNIHINKDKSNYNINLIISDYKEQITKVFENNLITSLSINLQALNDINYKSIIISDKLRSCMEIINRKVVATMFKEKQEI